MRTPIEKNLSPVARTLSESLRDAEYACAIQTFKSDVKLTIDFFLNAIIGFSIVGIAIALPIAIFMWLTK
jgi:hypothetical protein